MLFQSSSTPTSSSSSNTSKQQTKPEQSKVRAYNMSSNMFNFIIIKYTTLINNSQLQCYSQPCFIILNLDNKMLHHVTPDNKELMMVSEYLRLMRCLIILHQDIRNVFQPIINVICLDLHFILVSSYFLMHGHQANIIGNTL